MKKTTIREFTQPFLQDLLATILPMKWESPAFYGDFLTQSHFHISHTTRLLAAAGSRFELGQEKFHLQCMKHAAEERSHEKLSLSDLAAMGLKVENFSELQSTKALYRNAYFLIERMSPLTLFGYAYFLECVGAAGAKIEDRVIAAHGAKSCKHLSLHAHEDPGHIQGYEAMLDGFPPAHRSLLEEGIVGTAFHYKQIYLEIERRASSMASGSGHKKAG